MLKLKTNYSTETGELTVRFPKRVRDLAAARGELGFTIEGSIVSDGPELDVWTDKATAQATV